MKLLEDRILKDGKVGAGNVLKVDSFLNHQVDALFMDRMAQTIHEAFKGERIDRIMTVEASGIALAQCAAMHFKVPFVFTKKAVSGNIGTDVYVSQAYS